MKILCKTSDLNLKYTLRGGQSFRWQESNGKWIGVFNEKVWILHQKDDFIFYEVLSKSPTSNKTLIKNGYLTLENQDDTNPSKRRKTDCLDAEESKNLLLIRNYFHLDDVDLTAAYYEWSSKDEHFKNFSIGFQGIRILNQDPVENLFSFICSSNNNITRISSMVEEMCSLFGEEITCFNGKKYFSFPRISSLAAPGVEAQLRLVGFGYRAPYVHQTATKLVDYGGRNWLENLKKVAYIEAKQKLVTLPGVGPKVADCVCLMSLGFLEAVPIDVHMFKVAGQYYLPSLANFKSVTPRIYEEIGNHFRKLFGPLAGWAQSVLFCSTLRIFDAPSENRSTKQRIAKGTKKKNS